MRSRSVSARSVSTRLPGVPGAAPPPSRRAAGRSPRPAGPGRGARPGRRADGWCSTTRACGRIAALPGVAGREQDRRGRRRLADAGGVHRRADELHRVVDRQHRRDRAAGRVEVEVDRHVAASSDSRCSSCAIDHVGDPVVDLGAEVDDPVGQQPAVDVHGPFAARRLLDDAAGSCSCSSQHPQSDRPARAGRTSSSDVDEAGRRSRSPRASSAVNQRSRSASALDLLDAAGRCARRSGRITRSRCARGLSAWISMSTAVPPMPAEPWCISTRECGRA